MNLRFFRALQSLPPAQPKSLSKCLLGAALGLLIACAPASRAQQAPLRVAIVGLVHGHVEGFIRAFPQHPNVQLVGISEPDAALRAKYAKKDGLAQSLFFARC